MLILGGFSGILTCLPSFARDFYCILGGPGVDRIYMSNDKNLGWLFDIGDYTTQLYGDYNKPI